MCSLSGYQSGACVCYRKWDAMFSPGRIQRRRRGRGWRWPSRNTRTSVSAPTAALPRPPSWREHSWSQSHTRGCPWWVYGPAGCPAEWGGNSGGGTETQRMTVNKSRTTFSNTPTETSQLKEEFVSYNLVVCISLLWWKEAGRVVGKHSGTLNL